MVECKFCVPSRTTNNVLKFVDFNNIILPPRSSLQKWVENNQALLDEEIALYLKNNINEEYLFTCWDTSNPSSSSSSSSGSFQSTSTPAIETFSLRARALCLARTQDASSKGIASVEHRCKGHPGDHSVIAILKKFGPEAMVGYVMSLSPEPC